MEYDYFPPTQLFPTLETELIDGLYFAGYGQLERLGAKRRRLKVWLRGANAALKLQGRSPLSAGARRKRMGVLIDDLVTKGTEEPISSCLQAGPRIGCLRDMTTPISALTNRAFDVGISEVSGRWVRYREKRGSWTKRAC